MDINNSVNNSKETNNMKKYTFEEAIAASLEYFKGDELAAKVFVTKYALKDSFDNIYESNPDHMQRRIAKELARVELNYPNPMSEYEIYDLLKGFKHIVPQGGPATGIGNNFQVASLSNCFVIGDNNPGDSYGYIFKVDQELVQINKRRGGGGTDLSHYRPAKAPVMNSALNSTGIVPFMERYSNSTREVAQDGRRGALMLTLDIKHPDAEAFIDAKTIEGKVTGANCSIKISDEFIDCVLHDKPYIQQFPIDSDSPILTKTINARKIWDKLILNNWKSAEPGILLWDNIIKESIPDCYKEYGFATICTNPCVAEGTLVNTPRGYIKVEDLKKGDTISTIVGCEPIESIEIHDDIDINKIEFSDGGFALVTLAHRYHAIKKGTSRAKFLDLRVDELVPGDYVRVETTELDQDINNIEYKTGLKIGILLSDGCYTNDRIKYNGIKIASNKTDSHYNEKVMELFGKEYFNKPEISNDNDCYNLLLNKKYSEDLIENLHLAKKYSFDKFIPAEYFSNKAALLGIIDGLIATDGNILNSKQPAIRITTTSHLLAQDIRRALLMLGMHAKIYKSNSRSGKINGRLIIRKHDVYNVHILGKDILNFFNKSKLKHIHTRKYEKLATLIKENTLGSNFNFTRIKSITHVGKSKVYDLYCKESDTWITDGYVQRGCGEVPLAGYDSCRLIVLNLLSYVDNAFKDDSFFNFDKFKLHSKYALRIMDDIIDLELEKIDTIIKKIESDPESDDVKVVELNLWKKIKDMAINGRRTGIGITGEGDMLAALNHTYASDASIVFAENVQKTLAVSVYTSSIELAKERGCFPIWSHSLEKENPFLNRMFAELDVDTFKTYKKTGRRNIACLTIAPTGTTSIMTQTSSGVEPIFAPFYKRRRKVNPTDKDAKIAFVDGQGDSWEEYYVFHHGFATWAKVKGYDDIVNKSDSELNSILQLSPYFNSTANSIDWVQRVKLQGALQKWVDHSISSTVNLPEDVKPETVSKIFETAWKYGCKGITIYRDGSRDGVLLNGSSKKKEEFGVVIRPGVKRPKELDCDIHHVTANSQRWIVLIGLMESSQDGLVENRPYEVFAFPEKNLHISDKVKKGKLIKIRKGVYNLITDNGIELEDLKEFFEKNEQDALTRMISISLRTGADLKYIHEQLDKAEGSIVSFAKAISRTLKKYLKELATDKKCPSCGDIDGLQYKEGCMTCKSCGFSKCG